jgi:hypothetical protein
MLRNQDCLLSQPENLFYPPRKGHYVYFETVFPSPAGPAAARAAWAADAAMLAYARYGKTRMDEVELAGILHNAGFAEVQTLGDCFVDGANTARGFFAGNDDFAVLAFRGTEGDNPNDIEADLFALMPEAFGGRVHRGFLDYFQSVWWRVAEVAGDYRERHPASEICITGHSLGGALATLAFRALADPHSSLITFGCPRVGDEAFCQGVEALAGPCHRVVDNQDVVTHIPLPVPGLPFRHPRMPVLWLNASGKLVENPAHLLDDWRDLAHVVTGFVHNRLLKHFRTRLPRPLADHSPVRYCHWLSQALPEAARASA